MINIIKIVRILSALNQRGFIQIIPVILLLLGLGGALYLVQQKQLFTPKAGSSPIIFLDENGSQITKTSSSQVRVQVSSLYPSIEELPTITPSPTVTKFCSLGFYFKFQDITSNGAYKYVDLSLRDPLTNKESWRFDRVPATTETPPYSNTNKDLYRVGIGNVACGTYDIYVNSSGYQEKKYPGVLVDDNFNNDPESYVLFGPLVPVSTPTPTKTPPITIIPTNTTVKIKAWGQPANGYPRIALYDGDLYLASFEVKATAKAKAQESSFTFPKGKTFTSKPTIRYGNDFYKPPLDRNVFIDYIMVNNLKLETEDPKTYSFGSWTSNNGCDIGYKHQEGLHCNGFIRYDQYQSVVLGAYTGSIYTQGFKLAESKAELDTATQNPYFTDSTKNIITYNFKKGSDGKVAIGTKYIFARFYYSDGTQEEVGPTPIEYALTQPTIIPLSPTPTNNLGFYVNPRSTKVTTIAGSSTKAFDLITTKATFVRMINNSPLTGVSYDAGQVPDFIQSGQTTPVNINVNNNTLPGTYNIVGILTTYPDNGEKIEVTAEVTVELPNQSKRVFITSTTYKGNLYSYHYAGPPYLCKERAKAAGLDGDWNAWIAGTSWGNPAETFRKYSGPYKLLNGVVVANGWSDLVDGSSPQNAISIDEFGKSQYGSSVWSNVLSTGQTQSNNLASICQGWRSSSKSYHGFTGYALESSNWSKDGIHLACDQEARIYCFEQ